MLWLDQTANSCWLLVANLLSATIWNHSLQLFATKNMAAWSEKIWMGRFPSIFLTWDQQKISFHQAIPRQPSFLVANSCREVVCNYLQLKKINKPVQNHHVEFQRWRPCSLNSVSKSKNCYFLELSSNTIMPNTERPPFFNLGKLVEILISTSVFLQEFLYLNHEENNKENH